MFNNFGQNNNTDNTIMFCRKSQPSFTFGKANSNQEDKSNPQQLFLLSKLCEYSIFDNMPKEFAISTKNNTCHFNLEMLKETSPVISDFIKDHPGELQYSLNINDEENTLAKFEKLYQGKSVVFDEDEIPYSQRITKILKIKNCPNFLKPESLRTNEIDSNGNSVFNSNSQSSIVIYQKWFVNYLNRDEFRIFTIKTKRHEYKCSIFGIYSSNVIYQIYLKDLNIKEYVYDFEDEYDEFQSICDLFNFKKVDITSNNMDSLKEIAEDLQINSVIKQINNYINNYEKFTQKIDEQQAIIDSIDQLFDLLYNINTHGIEKVKISILQSKWSKKEENVQELAAFILQVIRPSYKLQHEMADLIIQLSKEANESNKLDILLPFIVDKLMTFYFPVNNRNFGTGFGSGSGFGTSFGSGSVSSSGFGTGFGSSSGSGFGFKEIYNEPINYNNKCVFCFIRILYKRGIISKDEITEKLEKTFDNKFNNANRLLIGFFLPEILEINPKVIDNVTSSTGFGTFSSSRFLSNFSSYIKKYLPDKIDLYEKMLDSMEPDDELTKSILHDDVDTLQKIITTNEIDIENFEVPYNIFDNFEVDPNIINYAALYGSLKCFKYLLLNNGNIDQTTLYFAVYGGNAEIIKIVDQRCPDEINNIVDNNNNNKFGTFTFSGNQINSPFWFNATNNNNNNSSFGFGSNNNNNNLNNDENLTLSKIVNSTSVTYLNYSNINNIIASTIALHRNDLFDWIFEKKFVSKNKMGSALDKIAILSACHGNAHALIEMIDKGFDISLNSSKDVIFYSAQNGFCQLTQLLLSIIDQKNKKLDNKSKKNALSNNTFNQRSIVSFGNLSIFKLFMKKMNQNSLDQAILYAIELNYKDIINYYFDNYNISQNESFINMALIASFKKKTDEFYNFMIEKFKKMNPKIFDLKFYLNLLNYSCLYSNLMTTKTITDIILSEDPNNDFSTAFIKASSSSCSNICQYFIDKKVRIDYNVLSSRVNELGSIDEELFAMIINNVSPNVKHKFLRCIKRAIQNKNKKLIEFLLKHKAPMYQTLYEAVMTHDLEIVDLILKYNSKPSFINEKTTSGTAILVAASNKDSNIVKRLLSLPGIDPCLNNQQGNNALTAAISNLDYEMVDLILNFYGNEISNSIVYYAFQLINNCGFCGNQNDKKMWNIVKRFMDIKTVDPNFYNEQSTFLYKACLMGETEMVEYFLTLEKIDVNKYDLSSYNTPLIIAIDKKFIRIAELLINYPKTDLNLRNVDNESPLIIAVKNNLTNIVDLLVKNDRFDPFESRINLAFIYSNIEIARKLALLSFLDVNEFCEIQKDTRMPMNDNNFYEISALSYSTEANDIEKIDLIINHPSFDKYKSDIVNVIFIATKENNVNVFNKLMKLIDNDIIIRNQNTQSLLVFAAQNLSGDIIDVIFQNPNFDSKSEQILFAFVESFSVSLYHQSFVFNNNNNNNNNNFGPPNRPVWGGIGGQQQQQNQNQIQRLNPHLIPNKSSIIEIMTRILSYDDEHEHLIHFDKLLFDGKSFFTSIFSNFDEIGDVVDFLLQHGVDPNMPDKDGKYPLQKAINLKSLDFVNKLINLENIQFPRLKDESTYLHLAAKKNDSAILRILLEKNVIDINSVDKNGDTPLMEACRARISDNINLLFENENLDYLHCNKNGKDALALISNVSQNEAQSARSSKEAYRKKLISSLLSNSQFSMFSNTNAQENKEEEETSD